MFSGYNKKVLRVNLTENRTYEEKLSEDFCRCYLGGAGFVAYYLLKELKMGIDPLGSENKIIFALGPLTGASLSGASRNSVGAKSPLTGGIALSEVGEHWGAELKCAGFDVLIIEGKAKAPVYLFIADGKAELKDASPLWGLPTKETQEKIRLDHGDEIIKVASIGPAGENLVKFACVMNGLYDAAGRGGIGAVMGSKNFKAIAVRGRTKAPVAHPDKLKELSRWFAQNVKNLPVTPVITQFGTGANYSANLESGNVPVNNFRDGEFAGADNLDAVTIKETIREGMRRCQSCVLACKKVVGFEQPINCDPSYGGPEYETLAALGSNCGISDLKTVCKGNELCNAFSLDTISTGVVISFAMECFEEGLVNEEVTGGIKLNFGNGDALLTLIEQIAHRKGFGALLAEGAEKAAKKIGGGAEKLAMTGKGLEIPMHEPRLKPGLALGYMVNPHGADHCCNLQDPLFTGGPMLEQYKSLGYGEALKLDDIGPRKVALVRMEQLVRVIRDCMLMCWFCTWAPDQLPLLVNAATGWNTALPELLRVAERVLTMSRIFNEREGFDSENDILPERFYGPKTGGALKEGGLNHVKMDEAKRYYYHLMGWDSEKGLPLNEKLLELGLEWARDY